MTGVCRLSARPSIDGAYAMCFCNVPVRDLGFAAVYLDQRKSKIITGFQRATHCLTPAGGRALRSEIK